MLVEADLPHDPMLLRAMLVAAEVRITERDQRITDLEGAGTEAQAEIERLNAIITAFQRHRFGARSEQLDPDQLALAFEEIDAAFLEALRRACERARPDAVVNTAALTDVDGAEAREAEALEVNGTGAGNEAPAPVTPWAIAAPDHASAAVRVKVRNRAVFMNHPSLE